jgi:aminodeoxyfutalosine synthase
MQNPRVEQVGLEDIQDKVLQGVRLSLEDGRRLFQCPDPTAVGSLAHLARTAKHQARTTYVLNQQLNHTNICINNCSFCSYHRKKGQSGGFALSLEEMQAKIRAHLDEPITEIHIVGGCHPDLRLETFEALLQKVRELRPQAVLKCFTAVEIDHFARLESMSTQEVLNRLIQAGLDMLPGGGAEIFDEGIRNRICPNKTGSDRWLDIHAQAHRLGVKTNCTMLFGHVESPEHRLDHLNRLRELQDRTGGFVCFIPLPFLTRGNPMKDIAPICGIEELRTIAVSRLMLDNIPHVKSYWVMLGLKQAQAALYFGANDLDGTVVEEKIGHMAGADSPQILSRRELEEMIIGCGLEPVQRDGRFEDVTPVSQAGPS